MNLFTNAVKLPSKQAGKRKVEKQEIVMKGVQNLAELRAMIDNLTAVQKTLEGELKEAGFGEFLAMETKTRPESFKGVDGQATCSVEMRKRSSLSALNEDEIELLTGIGLTPCHNVITPELFGINPVHAKDMALMNKVSKVLERIVPADFFVRQEEKATKVVDDNMLAAAFALPHGSKERATALRIATTMALKPRLNEDYNLDDLSANIAHFLAAREEVSEEQVEEAVAIVQKQEPVAEAPAAPAKKATRTKKAPAAV